MSHAYIIRESINATRKRKQEKNSTSPQRKSPRLNKQSTVTATVESQTNRKLEFTDIPEVNDTENED